VAKLEYRLLDEAQGYPLLYYYDFMKTEEATARFACDYFIKEGKIYEKTSCAVEPGMNVIYVRLVSEENKASFSQPPGIGMGFIMLELREYNETETYPLIRTLEFAALPDLNLYLQADYITLDGIEWEKTSAEIDEERQVFVIYLQKTVSSAGVD
jgi:hypothetical protein